MRLRAQARWCCACWCAQATRDSRVGEIQERTAIPASTLAHHLGFLAAGGLVEQERRGRTVINRAAYRRIEALAAFLLEACCADARPSPQARAARAALSESIAR